MTVMKFVQLFILKKKLRESMIVENNNLMLDRSGTSNDLLDLTCIICKEKYTKLLDRLKVIQSFSMLPNVSKIGIDNRMFCEIQKDNYLH